MIGGVLAEQLGRARLLASLLIVFKQSRLIDSKLGNNLASAFATERNHKLDSVGLKSARCNLQRN